jgi:GAF domain-containing protein/HAMP domain-containing protein
MPEKPITRFLAQLRTTLGILLSPRTIRARLVRLLTLLVLLPSLVFVVTSAVVGMSFGRQQAINQLEAVASLKQENIDKWVTDLQYDMALELLNQPLVERLNTMLNSSPDSPEYKEAYSAQVTRLKETVNQINRFEEFFIMDTKGEVILSTDPTREKQVIDYQDYFREGLKGKYISTPFYVSAGASAPSVIFSQPVVLVHNGGQTIGVFAGRASMGYLTPTVSGRAGLGQTGETYLVNSSFSSLTHVKYSERLAGDFIKTYATEKAIQNKTNGSGLYTGYYGQGVVGIYKWLPDLQIILVAEQAQSEAFAPIYTTLGIDISVTLIALVLAVFMALLFARNIGDPITHLANAAGRIASGDLAASAPVERLDEIGLLATAFNSMTTQLRQTLAGLEQRVKDRTVDLEQANLQTAKRAQELETISEVSRIIATEQNLNKVLPLVTRLVSERFNYYHTGIFLLDEAQTYAVLRATNSEGGQRMLERGHKLEVGQTGIVGFVAQKGIPRIALDVGDDAVFFNNPDLPDTRSEIALPLKIREKTIGVLDVQSTEPAAFTQATSNTLSILADQVAIAIENTRLISETQRALTDAQTLYSQFVSQKWEKTSGRQLGYWQSLAGGKPIEQPVHKEEIEQALRNGEMTVIMPGKLAEKSDNQPSITVPIKLRDQIIGVLNVLSPDKNHSWNQNEITLTQAISDRIGVALENARLLEDSQRRAMRERAIGEISSRISEKSEIDAILRSTVEELGKKLRDAEITVEINETATEEQYHARQ